MTSMKEHPSQQGPGTGGGSVGPEEGFHSVRPRTAPPPLLRRARPADTEALRSVYQASVRELAASHYPPEQLAAWASQDPWALGEAEERVFVAEEQEHVVGFASLHGNEVRALYLHPGWAGRGLGRQLLGALEEEARQRGERELVVRSSLNAAPFFEGQGYQDVRRVSLPLPGGGTREAVEMRKELAPSVH